MRLGTILHIAGGLVGAFAAAVTAVVVVADFNDYRTDIAAAIEAQTGRKVEFGGDIALRLGRTTALTANDVRLANAKGGSGPDMLRVAEVSAEVDVMPLWHREVVIRRLVLRGANILVDIDKRGRTNFDFLAGESASAAAAAGDDSGFSLWSIGDVEIRDASITIRDARDGSTQQLALRRLSLHDDDRAGRMHVVAAGQLDVGGESLAFDLKGRSGDIAALVAQDKPYPVDVRGKIGAVDVAAKGTIADPFAASGLALALELNAGDITSFAAIFGAGLPPVGPVHFTARLTGEPEKLAFGDLVLALGDTRATGDLTVGLAGERAEVEGTLAATRLDLVPWLAGDEGVDENRPQRVFNNDAIDFTVLQNFDGRLAITAAAVVASSDLTLRDATLSFDLTDGKLRTGPVRARLDGRTFAGALSVDSRVRPPRVALKLSARDVDIGRVFDRIFDEPFLHGPGGMDLAIAGQGWSVADIMGSSMGHARLLMDAGEVKTGSLGVLVGGVSELLDSSSGDWTAINCLATDFDLKHGIATSRVALLDARILRLVGEGTVDLAQDTIAYQVVPSPKVPTLNVAVAVNLDGPLADPSITPDELSVLARLGGLVGAIIFPPAALLSLGSLGSHDNPCLEAVQEAEVAPPAETPDSSGNPEAEAPPETGGSSDRLIDAVRQLLPLQGG